LTAVHTCRRCGASCEGLKVRPRPDEVAVLEARAAELGVDRPISGVWLRQVWGRCVFLDQGACRLHTRWGPDAKPSVCRTFPVLSDGRIDPACFHAGEPTGTPDPVILDALDALEHGWRVRAKLDRLPLAAVLEGHALGPQTTDLLRALIPSVGPRAPSGADRALLASRIDVALAFQLGPHPADEALPLLAGGGQLVVAAGIPVGAGFAAWSRLVRVGLP
jgi:Fe-S-cluster containining protein